MEVISVKLNKFELNNFGIYYENIEIDLSTKDNNIILIGGENGAGKTTLLNAIKICLYGSISMGFKTNTEQYLNEIKNYYNYSADNENKRNMYLKMKLTLNYKGDKIPLLIERSWEPNNNFKEVFSVFNLSNHENIEENDFKDYFHNVFPPSLFDFFIFDGELINDMFYTKEFNNIFKNSVKTVLNLNLPETIRNDLEKVQQKRSNENISSIEKEYNKLKFKTKNLKEKIQEKKNNLTDIKEEIKNKKSKKEALEKRFNEEGGIYATERNEFKNKISNLENEKIKIKDEINKLTETLLPFFMNENLLIEIKKQLEKESGFKTYNEFNDKISDEKLMKIKNKLINNNLNENINIDKYVEIVIDEVKSTFKPKNINDNFTSIHYLSYPEEERLLNIINKIISFNKEQILVKVDSLNEIQNEIYNYKQKLKINEENSDLKNLLKNIEKQNVDIGRLKEKQDSIIDQIEELELEFDKINEEKNDKYDELKGLKKEINIPVICEKVDSVLEQFVNIQLNNKLDELENKFLEIINKLFSIENYITSIEINRETYKINLYGSNQNKLLNLSSGEQELVILALLWSLSEMSKRIYPLVFDTLLGRIDEKHRDNIIKFLLAKSKKQIIILSTDSEINEYHYDKIAPFIERDYLIFKKDKLNHKSIIEKNFFYRKEQVI
ncbi:DNA sulfur modification protein DndD [Halanaerobium congolense]|jgi:DNA sulfur modification protein DndD|uniref:Nuclease SbcCD subunit C n=1 Tax=Halanaerobium congolense TaxID=54121 RepID=A0A4R7DZZ8_9FIRM|nr:DNA sulfur modification protein DndD [Halanaerobium congolense]SDK99912.1 DNA sulfur modification protein DndD [Halanaerobium congolense]SDN05468.1 DNA sulfur modification protein DndD [Halanaerobium congolense]